MDTSTIVRMFNSGVEADEIASTLGTPKAAVLAVLTRQKGQLDRPLGPTEKLCDREQVVAAYQRGCSFRELQRDLGIPATICWSYVAEAGLPIRDIPVVVLQLARERRDVEATAMYVAGHRLKDICHSLATTQHAIYAALKRHKIVTRREGMPATRCLTAAEVQADLVKRDARRKAARGSTEPTMTIEEVLVKLGHTREAKTEAALKAREARGG